MPGLKNKIVLPITAVLGAIAIGACTEQPEPPPPAEQASAAAINPACNEDGELLLHVPSPDWRDQIFYMLMIDRFNDGDPSINDQGAGEYDRFSGSHFTGGDLVGITQKVDYLKDLGITSVWITPPVYNQWWSKEYEAAGWHGYWATHFNEVDPHFGTLDDYRQLSHKLHCNGMYLIQDIVVNHVGNFYDYDGEYDPTDTAKNFFLIEEGHPTQEGPSQYPFNMINRLDPEHAAADIYHWTPPVQDYTDRNQELTYGLGTVADINTENPVVIEKFKEVYEYWIREVGVDSFRVDTVMLVPVEFFRRFLHDENGIYSRAEALGKDFFLTFGEVVAPPTPFDDKAEQKVTSYLGTSEEPVLNSMLGYPLYFTLKEVLGGGRPTSELAYRLDTFMRAYRDPYIIPNFVDNHDTARFLVGGSASAFRQALAVVMTVPGIPIIFQGTEQGLLETRQTMFGPAFDSPQDNFNQDSEYFRYIKSLAELRTANKIFTRGTMKQLASSDAGSGVFAYQRSYEGETALVLLNTAEHAIFIKDIATDLPPSSTLRSLFQYRHEGDLRTDSKGSVSGQFPGRSVVVVTSSGAEALPEVAENDQGISISIETELDSDPYSDDIPLRGSVSKSNANLQLVINGNLDAAIAVDADANGDWAVDVPVRNYGESKNFLQMYSADYRTITEARHYRSNITEADLALKVIDSSEDAKGPTGKYVPPLHEHAKNQLEVESAEVKSAGANLELILTTKNVTDGWVPLNGFDNVTFTIFMDFPGKQGVKPLPLLNAEAPEGVDWSVGHFVNGWNNSVFSNEGATDHRRGNVISANPEITVNKEERTITLLYRGGEFGVTDWHGSKIYITTWEANGEAVYLPIAPEPEQWFFSGAAADDPKIMDDLLIQIPASPDS